MSDSFTTATRVLLAISICAILAAFVGHLVMEGSILFRPDLPHTAKALGTFVFAFVLLGALIVVKRQGE
jgi:hypothetical protein